jgi:hypothetical protein
MIAASILVISLISVANRVDVSFVAYSKSAALFFLLYLLYPLLTVFWVDNLQYYYLQIRYIVLHFLIYYITFFFLVKIFTNHKLFLKMILGIGVIYILTSLWELRTGNHLSISRYSGIQIPIPTGFYYNENNQTVITSMMLPIAGYFFLVAKKFYQQLVYISIVIFFVVIAALAGARISMIISIPFLMYLLIKKRSLKLIGLIVIALLMIYGYISIHKSKELELAKAYLKFQYESIGQEVDNYTIGSTKIRINMIKNAFDYFQESKLVGVGAGNYDYHAKKGEFAKIGWIENTHSYLFELLANYGIVIVIPFIFFLFSLFKKIVSIYYRERGETKILAEMNMFQVPIFFLVGFIPSSLFSIFQVWVFIGYLSAFVYMNREKSTYDES